MDQDSGSSSRDWLPRNMRELVYKQRPTADGCRDEQATPLPYSKKSDTITHKRPQDDSKSA